MSTVCINPQTIKVSRDMKVSRKSITSGICTDWVTVPCGSCPNCLRRRSSSWSHRLLCEAKNSRTSYFLTLTIDNDHLLYTRKGFKTLDRGGRSYCTLLWKRIRKAQFGNRRGNLKYFLVGEYGGQRQRPHYHALVFNLELDKCFSKADQLILRMTDYNGKAHVYMKQWPYGYVSVGKVEGASVGYCLKYMCKTKTIGTRSWDDRLKEFSCMSKGLGACYMTKAVVNWHKDNLSRFYAVVGSKRIPLARYFKERIYDEYEREIASQMAYDSMITNRDKLATVVGGYEHLNNLQKQSVYAEYVREHGRADKTRVYEI